MVELGDLLLVVMDVMLVVEEQATTEVVAAAVAIRMVDVLVEVQDTLVDLDLTL
jgi:hypothetical protein